MIPSSSFLFTSLLFYLITQRYFTPARGVKFLQVEGIKHFYWTKLFTNLLICDMLTRISKFITNINEWIVKRISWISLLLILLICVDVVLRYLFSNTKTWIIELEWHLFAFLFLLGGAGTMVKNEHVRVDLFYNKLSEKNKSIVNILGTIFLLIPWCVVIVYTSYNYGMNSLHIHEGSPDPGGLPARYIIKFSIMVGFILLLLQAIAKLIEDFNVLLSKEI